MSNAICFFLIVVGGSPSLSSLPMDEGDKHSKIQKIKKIDKKKTTKLQKDKKENVALPVHMYILLLNIRL